MHFSIVVIGSSADSYNPKEYIKHMILCSLTVQTCLGYDPEKIKYLNEMIGLDSHWKTHLEFDSHFAYLKGFLFGGGRTLTSVKSLKVREVKSTVTPDFNNVQGTVSKGC